MRYIKTLLAAASLLTATAGNNSYFNGWSGEGCSGKGTCTM